MEQLAFAESGPNSGAGGSRTVPFAYTMMPVNGSVAPTYSRQLPWAPRPRVRWQTCPGVRSRMVPGRFALLVLVAMPNRTAKPHRH